MIKKTFFILLFSLFSSSVFAQSSDLLDQGSIYSKYGLGMPVVHGSPAADGMGLWGVSFIEPNVPGMANPAHWGSAVYAMATGGFNFTNYYSEDLNSTSKHFELSLNHFQLVLPVFKGKLGVSIGFMPYTNTSYRVVDTGMEINPPDTVNYRTVMEGEGGVNKLQAGIGWRISDNISIGYATSLVFASIDNIIYSTLSQDEEVFQAIDYQLQTSGIGWGNRFGVYFDFPSLFTDDDKLSLGASLTLPVEINAENELETLITNRGEDGGLQDDQNIDQGTLQLPMGFLAGITYQPIPKLAFSVEGLYQEWSSFKNTMEPGEDNILVDRYKIGAGIRYFPFLTGSDKFLSNFKYRLGVSYDQGHLNLRGHRIETLMFSFGLGYITPLRNLANSSIDVSFHYGIRGTKTDNLVQEDIWKIKVSINLAELFFYRPKVR